MKGRVNGVLRKIEELAIYFGSARTLFKVGLLECNDNRETSFYSSTTVRPIEIVF